MPFLALMVLLLAVHAPVPAGSACPVLPPRTFYCLFMFDGPTKTQQSSAGIVLMEHAPLHAMKAATLETSVAKAAGIPPESLRAVSGQIAQTTRQSPLTFVSPEGDGVAVSFDGSGKHLHAALCSVENHRVQSTTGSVPMTSGDVLIAALPSKDRDRFVAVLLPRKQEQADRDSSQRKLIMSEFQSVMHDLHWAPMLNLRASWLPDSCGECRAAAMGE